MTLLRLLAVLLILAAVASASLSPWLALTAAWAALIVAVLVAVNWYRGRVEQTVSEEVIARLQRNGLIRFKHPRGKS